REAADVAPDLRDADAQHARPRGRLGRLVLEEVDELVRVAARVVAGAAVEPGEAPAVGDGTGGADGLRRRLDARHVLSRRRGERVAAGARHRLGHDLARALYAGRLLR